MAIGLAFVDIVGDTSRTAAQVERDMNHALAAVEDEIAPVTIQTAVDAGTEQELTRELSHDIRAVQAAIQAIQVNANLDQDTRARLQRQLQQTTRQLRAARSELQVRVDNRPIIEDTVEAVQEAVHIAEAVAPPIEIETHVDMDSIERSTRSFKGIAEGALGAGRGIASLGAGVLALGAGLKAAAGLVSVLQAAAPAAALAAPAVTSVALAMGTLKLATAGVGDAVKAAFDPSDPKKYAEALKGLSPEARKFVGALHDMQPALKELQQGVQNRVFEGLAGDLTHLGTKILPLLQGSLFSTARTFNEMAHGVFDSATALSANGTLGNALSSANIGLHKLVGVPAQVVTAFGQLAAAAGPSFESLAAKAGGAADKLSERLSNAFQSGALQQAIQQAVSILGQLAHVAGNVGKILGSVFSAANANGATLVQTLSKVTDQLVIAFSSPAVQSGLQALFSTMGLISTTVAPLLGSALGVVAKALTALAPGVQTLVSALGVGLKPIIDALGPVLLSAGQAVSQLLISLSPLLPVIGSLIAQLGPVLTPILDTAAVAFQRMAPLIQLVADTVGQFLTPILQQLPSVIQPFLDQVLKLIDEQLPVWIDLLTQLQPSLMKISDAIVQLFGALAPLIPQLVSLISRGLEPILPLLPQIIGLVSSLAGVFADELAFQIQHIVIPAINTLVALLNGDGSGAFKNFKTLVKGVLEDIVRQFILLPANIVSAISGVAEELFGIGVDMIKGLVRGIVSAVPGLRETLNTITKMIPEWKGPEDTDRKLLVPAGKAIMNGLMAGIGSREPALESQLGAITAMISASGARSRPMMGAGVVSPTAAGAVHTPVTLAAPNLSPVFKVFVGTREIEDIVGVEVSRASQFQARQITTGMRR